MRLIYFFTFCFSITLIQCKSEKVNQDEAVSSFENYTKSILEDSLNRWSEYPKPPVLTKEILAGLEIELKIDSAKYYFEKLSPVNMRSHQDYLTSLKYFEKKKLNFCILAMLAHWNPDTRTRTAMFMNSQLKLRREQFENGKLLLKSTDKVSLRFLIYLFEYNPVFINGSENATIHDNYISNLAWNIDLLTGENFTIQKSVREWYQNDLNYETIILKWKGHLNNK